MIKIKPSVRPLYCTSTWLYMYTMKDCNTQDPAYVYDDFEKAGFNYVDTL